jgi:transposase InsO family protein
MDLVHRGQVCGDIVDTSYILLAGWYSMPWPVKNLMSVRLELVNLVTQPDANVRQLCRRFGVSPTMAYKWKARFEAEGVKGLADQSRRPRRSPGQTVAALEEQIVALRQKHPAWGGRKLRRRLMDLGDKNVPAASTITGVLHRHHLISPQQSQAAEPLTRFERPAPNDLWQVDFKGDFAMGQGRCHPLCALDDHSRYNVVLAACANQQEVTVQGHLTEAFRTFGLPAALLCDNGAPWGSCGDGEHTTLDVWLLRLGIRVYHGRPFHPQTQGKEERFHRTLKAEVLQRGGWRDCAHVQQAFDQWRPLYNGQRPHEALNLDTPLSRYRPSPRSFPEKLPSVEYDHGLEVRRVDINGRIAFGGQTWKVGRAFVKERVAIRPGAQDGLFEIIFMTRVIKELDLCQNKITPTP